MTTSKTVFWMATASVAASSSNVAAQSTMNVGQNDLPNAPITQMSTVTKGQVQGWVDKVKILKPNFKPSDDPDYSEFWIELHPKGSNDITLPSAMSLSKPLSGQLLAHTSPKEITTNGKPVNDLTEYIKNKAHSENAAFTDWSEEAFGEIGPDYAEIAGPNDMNKNILTKKLLNSQLSIRALDKGKKVPPEYYQEILKNIEQSKVK